MSNMKFHPIPSIITVSKLKTDFTNIVPDLISGQTFIVSHPDVDAVLISKEIWNAIVEENESLRSALEAEAEYDAGLTATVSDLEDDFNKLLMENRKDVSQNIKKSSKQNKQYRKTRSA